MPSKASRPEQTGGEPEATPGTAAPAAAGAVAKRAAKPAAAKPAAKASPPKPVAPKPAAKASPPKPVAPKPVAPKPAAAKPAAAKPAAAKAAAAKPAAKASPPKPVAPKAPAARTAAKPAARPATKPATSTAAAAKPAAPAAKPAAKPTAPRAAARQHPVAAPSRSTFDAETLAPIREALLRQRAELQRQLTEIEEVAFNASQSDISGEVSYDEDSADAGSFTFEREKDLSIANNVSDLRSKIDRALHKIGDGTYGICESCGKPIEGPRLTALPHVTLCLQCKKAEERR